MSTVRRRLLVTITVCGLFGGRTLAGGLEAPASYTNANSAMFTLNDIYNVLNTRATVALRTNAFAEPTAGPTGTMHTLNDIMTLATNRAPVAKTGWTVVIAPGDDGTYQAGVAWPKPRFSVVGAPDTAETNQIRDNLTGLIWARDACLTTNSVFSVDGKVTWSNAFEVINSSTGLVNAVNYGGTNDWRLPNRSELLSLVNLAFYRPPISDGTGTNKWSEALGPFTNIRSLPDSSGYWASDRAAGDGTQAWHLEAYHGSTTYINKGSGSDFVWPVRGGQ